MSYNYEMWTRESYSCANWDDHYKKLLAHIDNVFNINNYISAGFEKVCEVETWYSPWRYKNINEDLMFSTHDSWTYFIVGNETILKHGETGNPLGIAESRKRAYGEIQPKTGSQSRFGRLRNGDNTDRYIRDALSTRIRAGQIISLWAKKCPIDYVTEDFGGAQITIPRSYHKEYERSMLNYFKEQTGRLPELNKASK